MSLKLRFIDNDEVPVLVTQSSRIVREKNAILEKSDQTIRALNEANVSTRTPRRAAALKAKISMRSDQTKVFERQLGEDLMCEEASEDDECKEFDPTMPCNRVFNKPRSLQEACSRKYKNNQRKNNRSVGKPEKCYVNRKKQEAFQKPGRQNACDESVESVSGTLKEFCKIALGLRSGIGEVADSSQKFQLGSPDVFYTSEISNKEETKPILFNSSPNKTKDMLLISVPDSVTKCQNDVSSIPPNDNAEGEDIYHNSKTVSIQMPQLYSVLSSVSNTFEVHKTMPQLLDSRLTAEENTSVISINDSVEKSPRTLTSNDYVDVKCNSEKSESQPQMIITEKGVEKKIHLHKGISLPIIDNTQLIVGDSILTQDAELDTALNNKMRMADSSLLRSFRDSKPFLGTASVIMPDKNRETKGTCQTPASGSHNGPMSMFCKKLENQVIDTTVSRVLNCKLEARQDHSEQFRHNSGKINSRIESYSVPCDNGEVEDGFELTASKSKSIPVSSSLEELTYTKIDKTTSQLSESWRSRKEGNLAVFYHKSTGLEAIVNNSVETESRSQAPADESQNPLTLGTPLSFHSSLGKYPRAESGASPNCNMDVQYSHLFPERSSKNEILSSSFEELKCLDTWLKSLLFIQDSATESLRSASNTMPNDSKILEDRFQISELVSNTSKSRKDIDTKETPSKAVDDKLNAAKHNSPLSANGSVKKSPRSEVSPFYNNKSYSKHYKKLAVDDTLKMPEKKSQKRIVKDISKIPENRAQKIAIEGFSKMPETKSKKEAVDGISKMPEKLSLKETVRDTSKMPGKQSQKEALEDTFKIAEKKIKEIVLENASKTPEKKSQKETVVNARKISGKNSNEEALEAECKMAEKKSQKKNIKDTYKMPEIKKETEGDTSKITEIKKEAVEDTSQIPGKMSLKEVLVDACRTPKKTSHKRAVEDISKRPKKLSQSILMSSTSGKSQTIALEKSMSSSLVSRLKQKERDPVLSFHDSVKKRARVEFADMMNNNLEENHAFHVPTITPQNTQSTFEKLEGNSVDKAMPSNLFCLPNTKEKNLALRGVVTEDRKTESCPMFNKNMKTVSTQTLIPQLQNTSMSCTPSILNNLDFDQVVTPLLVGLQNMKEENPMLSFFKGILPPLTSFTDDECIEFQSDVLSSIQKIKSKRGSN